MWKLHVLSGIIVTAYHKLCDNRKLLGCKTQSLLGHVVAHALYLYQDTPWSYRRHESLGITFTFTHADLGRLLGDGLVGENAYPYLALALHVACHGDTGGLYLAAGDPF